MRRSCRVVAILRPERGPDRSALEAPLKSALAGCDIRFEDLTGPGGLGAQLAGLRVDGIVSCIASRTGVPEDAWRVDYEANLKLLDFAQSAGAQHFVLLSAICVQRPMLEFQRAKLAFEAKLRDSGLNHSIVRPTAYFKSLAGQVERVRRGKPFLVFGNGDLTACKPIGEADLAEFIVDCLEQDGLRNRILPIGGPGYALTPRQQGQLLFEASGMKPKFRSVPVAMFDAALAILAPLSRVFPGLRARAELARIGHYYATESMLLWDEELQGYDAAATPATGRQTLAEFYRKVWNEGMAGQELGEHKLF